MLYNHKDSNFDDLVCFVFLNGCIKFSPQTLYNPFVWISFLFSTNRIDEKKNLEKISKMMMMMMTFSFLSPPLYMIKIFFLFAMNSNLDMFLVYYRCVMDLWITDNKNKEFFFLLNLDIQNVRHFKWQLQQQHAKDFCLEDS